MTTMNFPAFHDAREQLLATHRRDRCDSHLARVLAAG